MKETVKSFGRSTKEERLKQGISLRSLASITGLCFSTISRLERGEYSPTLDNAIRIAKALGFSIDSEAHRAPGREDLSISEPSRVAFATYIDFKLQKIKLGERKNISKISSKYQFVIIENGTVNLSTHGRNTMTLARGAKLNCSILRSHTYWVTAVSEVDLFWLGPTRL